MPQAPLQATPIRPTTFGLDFSGFMTRTYFTMAGGLGLTAAIATAMMQSGLAYTVAATKPLFWGVLLAELALVWVITSNLEKLESGTSMVLFLLYAALNGVSMAPLFLIYDLGSVANVFGISMGTFAATAFFGQVTKMDLTRLGGFLMMALIGIIIAGVVNLFLRSDMMSFYISLAAVAVFIGLTAYDVQKLRNLYNSNALNGKGALHVYGALQLYLDFVNLFINLLRLLGKRK
jgi:uncharacterized protein